MPRSGVVLISDIHYSINNLEIADKCLRKAIEVAHQLGYELIIAGDLNDTKAILRAEVVNRLIDTMRMANDIGVHPTILVGNHDLLNEKGKDHSLEFLLPFSDLIHTPVTSLRLNLIPYQASQDSFIEAVSSLPKELPIICHQGFLGAFMGDYIQDKTSVDPNLLAGREVYSGHYHRHQKLGPVTYIGSPYTITFGEANDGPKGFLVIDPAGRVKQVKTEVRKHVVVERDATTIQVAEHGVKPNDLLWLKVTGHSDWLNTLDKEELGQRFIGHSNFKLDLIPNDKITAVGDVQHQTPIEILYNLVDNIDAASEKKEALKSLAKELLS